MATDVFKAFRQLLLAFCRNEVAVNTLPDAGSDKEPVKPFLAGLANFSQA